MATAAIISAGVSVGGKVAAHKKQKKAAKQQRRANDIQRRLAEIKNARARRQLVAEAQLAQSQIEAEAAASGVSATSSGARGSSASVQAQLGSELGFSQLSEKLGGDTTDLLNAASKNQSRAATFGAISNLPSQLGFQPSLASVFTANKKPKATTNEPSQITG